jgi:hypothetical protein
MTAVHIYRLSRLVNALPGSWEQMLESIEANTSFASRYYQPMREAVLQFCSSHGQNKRQIVNIMTAKARTNVKTYGPKMVTANIDAFEVFETEFYPNISKFRRSFLNQRRNGCDLAGVKLHGGPHFEVTDHNGRKRYVFLHAADWADKDLKAYLELLGYIIEKDLGADSSALWVMDLKHAKEVKWKPSSRVLKRCQDAAKHYARFVNTMEQE